MGCPCDQLVQDRFRTGLRIVGMNPHGCIQLRVVAGEGDRSLRCAPVNADNDHPMNGGLRGTLNNLGNVRLEDLVVQMAVTVKNFHN
jgi:hypothetical protein